MGQVVRIDEWMTKREPPSDGDLARAAVSGDEAARERLFRRYSPKILRFVGRLMGRADEDLAQEVCIEVFRNLHRLRDPDSFESWVNRICVHRARSRFRRQAFLRRVGVGQATVVDPARLFAADAPQDVVTELRTLYTHISDMPAEVRMALLLRRVEGMTIPEIAAHMDRSPATVKRRIEEGMSRLSALVALTERDRGGP